MYYARRKGQDIPIGDGVIKQIERYCENSLSVLTTRWLEYGVYERNLQTLSEYIRVCSERKMYDQLGRLLKMIYVSMQTQRGITGPITVVAKLR
jgi:hypothetical protein